MNQKMTEFDKELVAAIDFYGENHIDIIIDDEKVYGIYHSERNSFPVTNQYTLIEIGGLQALSTYEKKYKTLCVCVN